MPFVLITNELVSDAVHRKRSRRIRLRRRSLRAGFWLEAQGGGGIVPDGGAVLEMGVAAK